MTSRYSWGMNFDLNLFVNLAVLAVALVAIWFTVRESRRNNSPVLSIKECQSSFHCESMDENNRQPFDAFTIVIQNHGIALHDVKVALWFRDLPEYGSIRLDLDSADEGEHPQFARGMVAKFVMKSYLLDSWGKGMLHRLRDPVEQRAEIHVYSQGYLAYSFKAWSLAERLREKWNRLAVRVNYKLYYEIGKKQIQIWNILPTTVELLWPVRLLCRWETNELSRATRLRA